MSEEFADYAVTQKNSRGRVYPEKPHPYRSGFERDRDRIIHCSAFRRLEGKTQVFTPGLDDYYRTRLTHSIEVAQIGRTIAKELHLNESLTEAICLAHDLGHPPFGHAGEKVLNDLMHELAPAQAGGGFEHNRQTLRIVDLLEHPYPNFTGLNLMYETRIGLAKHRTTYDKPDSSTGFQPVPTPTRPGWPCYESCSLEGQITDLADRIAYNCHDLEDGLRAGLIKPGQLKMEIVKRAESQINAGAINDRTIRRTRTAKAIIDMLVSDCLKTSKKMLVEGKIKTVEDVYAADENLIAISAEREAELAELEEFLMQNFYTHKSLLQTSDKIRIWLEKLFKRFSDKPELMPGYFQRFIKEQGLHRTVCDYIAGMTDRFCLNLIEK